MTGSEAREKMKNRHVVKHPGHDIELTPETVEGIVEITREVTKDWTKKKEAEQKAKKPFKPYTPAANDTAMRKKGRLPHNSTFQVTYNAVKELWEGELAIGNVVKFTGSAHGVFRLLALLDDKYRDWLKENPAIVDITS